MVLKLLIIFEELNKYLLGEGYNIKIFLCRFILNISHYVFYVIEVKTDENIGY